MKIGKIKIGLPLQLVAMIIGCLLFGDAINEEVKRFFYTISLTIKDGLIFILPAIIFAYVFSCIMSLKKGSWAFVGLLLLMISTSNMVSALVAYLTGWVIGGNMAEVKSAAIGFENELLPYWVLHLPKWIPNDYALFGALGFGFFFSIVRFGKAERIAKRLKAGADYVLRRCLIPVIPFFIFGFLLNISHQGVLREILTQYGGLLVVMIAVQLSYIAFLYGVGARFSVRRWIAALRNVLPSGIAGFSTMSSAAAMPLTLEGAQKNVEDPDKVNAIVPITVNVHLIGDSIGIPIMALGMLSTFGLGFPDFGTYLIFAFFFVLAKYAVAAVPGGGILVMLPILEKYLGFDSGMLSLITALYILFDPFITMANVLGNGAFAVVYTKLYNWVAGIFRGESVAQEVV